MGSCKRLPILFIMKTIDTLVEDIYNLFEPSITNNIKLTSNNQIISDLINDNGPLDYIFSLGYSGWSEGQLEKEIEDGDWLIMPASYNHIFKIPNNSKWSTAAVQFGIDINSFSGGKSGQA